MLYFNCEKKVRAVKGKLRRNEVLRKEQQKFNLNFWDISVFQASLSGIFFENSESARHGEGGSSKVPGVMRQMRVKKESRDA